MLILIPALTAVASPWDEDSIVKIFSGRAVDDIEGVWKFTQGHAVILIHRASSSSYNIRLLDSRRLDQRPGTLIGEMYETPTKNVFDGKIKLKSLGKGIKLKSSDMVFKLTDDGYISFHPYKTGYSVSFARLFYRIFKIPITDNGDKPDGLIGAKRIYPRARNPRKPIRL